MKLKNYIIALYVLVFGLAMPVPAKWNIVLDSKGSTVEDYMWYFSYYGVLTLSFFMISKLTNNSAVKLLYYLSLGKLIDQIFNPYGYHLAEIIWDSLLTIWTLIELIKKWRKSEATLS